MLQPYLLLFFLTSYSPTCSPACHNVDRFVASFLVRLLYFLHCIHVVDGVEIEDGTGLLYYCCSFINLFLAFMYFCFFVALMNEGGWRNRIALPEQREKKKRISEFGNLSIMLMQLILELSDLRNKKKRKSKSGLFLTQ